MSINFLPPSLLQQSVVPPPSTPLAFLRSLPQFHEMRAQVRQDPTQLQQAVVALSQHHPQTLQAIQENPDEFLRMMNEPDSMVSGFLCPCLILCRHLPPLLLHSTKLLNCQHLIMTPYLGSKVSVLVGMKSSRRTWHVIETRVWLRIICSIIEERAFTITSTRPQIS